MNILEDSKDLLRLQFKEGTEHTGVKAKYYEVLTEEKNIYNDYLVRYKKAIELYVIPDESPKINVLKSLGWYVEEDEFKPFLVYFSLWAGETDYVLNVIENSLIEFNLLGGVNGNAKFLISKKQMDSLYGVYWVCKCVPYRVMSEEDVPSNIANEDTGVSFLDTSILKRERAIGIDACSIVKS